jgi:hypothetical protein
LILRGVFWLTRLDARTRWWIILGLFFAVRVARSLMRANPELRPFLMPLVVLYVVFAVSTWLMQPITNLLLRLNPYGRLVLSWSETLAANLVGGCIAIGAIAGAISLATGGTRSWGTLAIASLLMLIPVSGAFRAFDTRAWRPLLITMLALAALGVTAVVVAFLGLPGAVPMLVTLGAASALFTWVASILSARYS